MDFNLAADFITAVIAPFRRRLTLPAAPGAERGRGSTANDHEGSAEAPDAGCGEDGGVCPPQIKEMSR